MSWSIQMSGHATGDEVESEKVNALAKQLVADAREAGLNPSSGATSNNIKSLTWAELSADEEEKGPE